jgi:phosphatidate cytidylyltransferase
MVFGALFWSPLAWLVVLLAVAGTAQTEYHRVLRERGYRPAEVLGLAGGALIMVGAYQRGTSALSFGIVALVLGAFVWFLVDPHRERVVENLAVTLLGVLYIPFLGAHVVLIRDFPEGVEITFAFIGLVVMYDIGAYAAGSLFGKHPLAPSISPKKSWEGAFGATVFAFVMALLVGPLLGPFDAGTSAMMAGVVAVAAPLGDLAESLLKRDLGVKDMGGLLPGHGGMLDRIDALLIVAPVFYWLVRGVVL